MADKSTTPPKKAARTTKRSTSQVSKKQTDRKPKASTTKAKSRSRSTAANKQTKTTAKPKKTRTPKVKTGPSLWERIQRFFDDPEAIRNLRGNLPTWSDEVGAFALIILGVLTLSALFNPSGDLAAPFAIGLQKVFGIGSYIVALAVLGLGVLLLLPKAGIVITFDWIRILAIEVAFIGLQGLFHLLSFDPEARALAREGGGGGYVGWAISSLISNILGTWIAIGLLLGVIVYSLGIILRLGRPEIRHGLVWLSTSAQALASRLRPERDSYYEDDDGYYDEDDGGSTETAPAVFADIEAPSSAHSPFAPANNAATAPTAKVNGHETSRLPNRPSIVQRPENGASVETPPPPARTPAPMPAAATIQEPVKSSPPPPAPKPKQPPSPAVAASRIQAAEPTTAVTPSEPKTQSNAKASDNGNQASKDKVVENVDTPIATKRVATEAATSTAKTNKIVAEKVPVAPKLTTLTINGQVVTAMLGESGQSSITTANDQSSQSSSNSKQKKNQDERRYFVVDGFQDRVKIGRRRKVLPPLDALVYTDLELPDEEEINTNAELIEFTMQEFDIDADVIDVRVGPTVTQYAVSPIKEVIDEDGELTVIRTRVSKIAALSNDLALSLSTKTLRIEAPVPGHSYVGVEVPNREPSIVSLRPLLETETFYNERKKPLAVPLGRDVSGDPVVVDLATMPHLLVAGTTGSGKSVCLRSMITSLVMNNSPDTLRLIVLDPKMVELPQFNGLPHLMGPVETDTERIIGVLRWAAREMDRRYKLLELENARNIESYNEALGRRRKRERLPYVVIVVDEIGDLMMSRPDETEKTLTRLAQKARAAGMHLVVATQRPSVDVITGLIKANFPARISFAVASGVDSRVILDSVGAETLMGKGDMLFLGPDAAGPKRLQGCFLSDKEVDTVVDYWRDWHQQMIEDEKMDEPGTPLGNGV